MRKLTRTLAIGLLAMSAVGLTGCDVNGDGVEDPGGTDVLSWLLCNVIDPGSYFCQDGIPPL